MTQMEVLMAPMLQDYVELKRLIDSLYDVQETRKRVDNRMRGTPSLEIFGNLQPIEDATTKIIQKKLAVIPIWNIFMEDVKGLGPRLGSYIISKTMVKYIPVQEADLVNYSQFQQELAQKTEDEEYLVPMRRGIEAFANISKYWAYWGLSVEDGEAQRRKKGEKAGYDPVNRATMWKLGKQFVMQGERYRAHYDRYKTRKTEQCTPPERCPSYNLNTWCKNRVEKDKPPTCKNHIHRMAMRYAVKQFMKDLWINWRTLEGLSVTEPYVIAVLGHEKK